MATEQQTEFWLSGPIPGITPMLQPVAHALLQARKEIQEALRDFPGHLLWQRPGGVASVGFHLQHVRGVAERLFTYARNEQLSPEQLNSLQNEGKEDNKMLLADLMGKWDEQVEKAIAQLKTTKGETVLEERWVGRKRIPSNVLGLLFHAAEHIQRHTGQLLVTARVLTSEKKSNS
jgi:uncharacterized damage-inducible protein DinB